MPTAEAQIPTERASRYLEQLCRHLGQMSRMRHQSPAGHRDQAPPPVQGVGWSDSSGEIRFTHGTCTVQATPTALLLRVDADDEDSLRRLQDGITRRLETIGRRDHFTVDWQRPDRPSDNPPGDSTATPTGPTRPTTVPRPRRLGRTLAFTAVALLAVLVHLGLLGGAIATSPWASWGTNIILAVIIVKVLTVGIHLARVRLGRRGSRLIRGHTRHSAPTSIDPDSPTGRREHAI